MADEKDTNNKLAPRVNLGPRKFGIAALRDKRQELLKDLNPQTSQNRIGILFDDSGSMDGQPITDAKQGISNFFSCCNPQETSICIYPLNSSPIALSIDYTLSNVLMNGISARNGTPLYRKLVQMLQDNSLTRCVVFSDGIPEYDNLNLELAVKIALENKIPIDTVFIGNHPTGEQVLKDLSERTGGIFVRFEDSNTLSKQLKYLSPGLRKLLADPATKKKIEEGQNV